MHPATIPAQTTGMTLEAVVGRLTRHQLVDGILLMGSTGTGQLAPTSDYDLMLVLADLPAPLSIVTTWVDGRLTEIYCTTVQALARIAAQAARWTAGGEEGVVVHWLQGGRIIYDRAGHLAQAQAAARAALPALPAAGEIYAAWQKISYNVAQMKRYLASDDPLYQLTVDVRLLYSLLEVLEHYFTVRQLPWRGEKSALSWLADHDREYLERLSQCLSETERRRKVQQYEELARLTLAPVGPLWERGTTAIVYGAGFATGREPPDGTVKDALTFWRDLVACDAESPASAPSAAPAR